MEKIKVSVTGCSLADCVYTGIDFSAPSFRRYASRTPGDGGLVPGQLVFLDALAAFAGESGDAVLRNLTAGHRMAARNVGGPAIVSAINAAQLTWNLPVEIQLYGALGHDATADFIESVVKKTPLGIAHYRRFPGDTPSTQVLSDPKYHDGKGERTFINVIGAAGKYGMAELGDEFFASDVLVFSATALVPELHDTLTALLKRGRKAGRINVVTTVFDFRNEARNPMGRWPLGESEESYRYIDLLAVDWDEARRLSGEETLEAIFGFFRARGVSSVIITHGAREFHLWSDGGLFRAAELQALPVSALVDADLAAHPEQRGDTTGCGDNFAGGLLAALIMQLASGIQPGDLDIYDAAGWASASGGFACFCVGGTYLEQYPGEKYEKLLRYREAYRKQIGK